MSSGQPQVLLRTYQQGKGELTLVVIDEELNFGLGGIAAALLGVMADSYGVETVYRICSFLPLAGLLAWFLPRIDEGEGT